MRRPLQLNVSMIGANIFSAISNIPGLDLSSDGLGELKGLLSRRDDAEIVRRQFTENLSDLVSQIGDVVSSTTKTTPPPAPTADSGSKGNDTPTSTTTTTRAAPTTDDNNQDILGDIPIPFDVKSAISSKTADITSIIPTAVPTVASDIDHIINDIDGALPSPGGLINIINASIPADIRDTVIIILDDLQKFTGTFNPADGLAQELGLDDWYSLHLMGGCQGKYTPNPLAVGAGLIVSKCSPAGIGCRFSGSPLFILFFSVRYGRPAKANQRLCCMQISSTSLRC